MTRFTTRTTVEAIYGDLTFQFSIDLGNLSERTLRLPGAFFESTSISSLYDARASDFPDVDFMYLPFGRYVMRLVIRKEGDSTKCRVDRLTLPLDPRIPGRAVVINRVTARNVGLISLGNMSSAIEPYGFVYHYDSDKRWDGPKHSVFNDVNEHGTIAGSYGDRPCIFRVDSGRILASEELPTPWTDSAEAVSIDEKGRFVLGLHANELVYWTLEETGWRYGGRASEGALPTSSEKLGLAIHSMRDRWLVLDPTCGVGLYAFDKGVVRPLRNFNSNSTSNLVGDCGRSVIDGVVHQSPPDLGMTVPQYIRRYFDTNFPDVPGLNVLELRTWELDLGNFRKTYNLILVQSKDGAVKCFINCTWKRE